MDYNEEPPHYCRDCDSRQRRIDGLHAEVTRLRSYLAAIERTCQGPEDAKLKIEMALTFTVDALSGADYLPSEIEQARAQVTDLRNAVIGARDSFVSLCIRWIAEKQGVCECREGWMCIHCEAQESAAAMNSVLRGDTIGEDSPEDIELARKAFGDAMAKVPDAPPVPGDELPEDKGR